MAWLLAQRLPRRSPGCFAPATGPELPREPARLAWCYGDAGVAAALLLAARVAPEWKAPALRVALRAARRSTASAGVVDAGLCHGAAGVAHVFHRLFRETGEARIAQAARHWFAQTLAMYQSRTGFGGFRTYDSSAQGKPRWRAAPGFLSGTGGIALALVAAVTQEESWWDRALLIE